MIVQFVVVGTGCLMGYLLGYISAVKKMEGFLAEIETTLKKQADYFSLHNDHLIKILKAYRDEFQKKDKP